MMQSSFQTFFDCCIGNWVAERTYHYLFHQEVERSRTEFRIDPLSDDLKQKVLSDNIYTASLDLAALPGYHLSFHTVSETGEEVSQQLNFLFVPTREDSPTIQGDYLRDRAYEEARPIVSHFHFNLETHELLMTTRYTRVISLDSITLVNPNLRIRKIINYVRPPEGQPLEQVSLIGFGAEQKGG